MVTSSERIVLSDDRDIVKKLRHVGKKLYKNLASVHKLLELLDKLELLLSNLDQEPPHPIQESLVLPMKTLISDELLRHADDDVKISVTACLTEIARITAPNAPYNDEQMKEFLKLTVAAFGNLSHVSGRRYEKALTVLENVSKFKIFLIMLDLECDDLVIEMFQLFLRIIRSNHPSNVFESMERVMTGILDESEDISSDLLKPLLDSVRKENKTISPISWTLGEKVITNCAFKLRTYLMQGVESSGIALNEYPQIVTSICKNQSESAEHIHSTMVIQGLETDNTCARDDTKLKIRSTSATTIKGEVADSSGSKRKPHSCLTKNSKIRNAKTSYENGNLESVQELNSETQVAHVPRKRARKPNSLMNPEEGYDLSWVYKDSSAGKSSQLKKARDSSNTLTLSDSSNSRKDKTPSKPKTVCEALVSELKNEKIAKPAQSGKTCDKGDDFPSIKSPASTKSIQPANPTNMSKAHEAFVSNLKNDENTDGVPLTKHNIRDGNCTKRGWQRKSSSIGNQNDHPNSLSMLKDDNLNPLLKKTSSKSPVRLHKKSEVKMNSEIKYEAPIRKIKLSLKIDGKVVVPPETIISKTKSEVFGEDEGKDKPSTDIKVENREEGRTKANKRRRQTATTDIGFNKSSAMKAYVSQDLGNSLVGKRIKVWWPLDKVYYEGVVDAYDHIKGKHKILYNDGDKEQLNLKKQRWELVDDNVSPDEEEGLGGLQKLAEAFDMQDSDGKPKTPKE